MEHDLGLRMGRAPEAVPDGVPSSWNSKGIRGFSRVCACKRSLSEALSISGAMGIA